MQIVIKAPPSDPKVRIPDPVLMYKVVGNAVKFALQEHFERLNADRHRHGTPGFYEAAKLATFYEPDTDPPRVVVNQLGMRLRLYGTAGLPGGVLSPTGGRKYLTIPARDEAYGHKAGDIAGLKVVWGRRKDGSVGPIGLAVGSEGASVAVSRTGKRKRLKGASRRQRGLIMYWLVKNVVQSPDTSVVPTADELRKAGLDAMRIYVRQVAKGS